jgi:uncharacterized protein
MAWYLDTSAFIKLVRSEEHTADLVAWVAAHGDMVSSDLLRTEAIRAARRQSPESVLAARERLLAVSLVKLTTDVCERAAELDPDILRSIDALHLAAALTFGDDLEGIVTYDDRLRDAARLHGIATIAPGANEH